MLARATDQMESICVYCASSPGVDSAYAAAAVSAGSLLAKQGVGVVYGGGRVGLMGVLAGAAQNSVRMGSHQVVLRCRYSNPVLGYLNQLKLILQEVSD